MHTPILHALLGDELLEKLIKTWPHECVVAHGSPGRLPPPLNADILGSVEATTKAYQGRLSEIDPRKGYQMYPAADGTANEVITAGATAYLEDLSPLLENADRFTAQLERELGVQEGSANLRSFISAAGSGAPTHYDVREVISIQLAGRKKFFTAPMTQIAFPYGTQYREDTPPFDELYPQIKNGFPSCKDQSFTQIDMQPGSVLFMPRGTWHYTEAEDDSLAVSIILNPPTQLEYLIYHIKSTLLQDTAWRVPRYALGKTDKIGSKSLGKLPNAMYKMTKGLQNSEAGGQNAGKGSRYLINPHIKVDINRRGNQFDVTYLGFYPDGSRGDVRFEVAESVANVFSWLLDRDAPFTLRDCIKANPDVQREGLEDFFEKLSQSGLIRQLWFEPL